jgi:hypothetical protein
MGMIQIVLSTDGTAKILATIMGETHILDAKDESTWVGPDAEYALWGTRPENPAWRKMAEGACVIICWVEKDLEIVEKMFPDRVQTILSYTDSGVLASLYSVNCPTCAGIFREQGLYARLTDLDLPQQMDRPQIIAYDPSRREKILTIYPCLEKCGEDAVRAKIKGKSAVRYIMSGEIMMVENTGQPVLLTGRVLLARAAAVVQYTPDGRLNVQSDGRVNLDPAAFFARDSNGNIRGGGSPFCMGGTPLSSVDFSGAATIDLCDLF